MTGITTTSLVVAIASLLIGAFVIIKFCTEQFDKPIMRADDNDPWKSVMTRYLAPPNQYLLGFSTYVAALIIIFVAVSIVGPVPVSVIGKALAGEVPSGNLVDTISLSSFVKDYSTFPILVAFYIVGLNPNLPQALNFEAVVRSIARRIAHIPKNVELMFNYMRFSDFDPSDRKLEEAWSAMDLRVPAANGADLRNILPILNRTVVLYVYAATLSGDLTFGPAADVEPKMSLEVFKQFRNEIRSIGVNIVVINTHLSELGKLSESDRHRAIQDSQRDLTKNLERLYVILACALTVKGLERVSDTLLAIGFTSHYPPRQGIPWNPILNVVVPSMIILFVACIVAAQTFQGIAQQSNIPTDTGAILQLLIVILVVHSFAIGNALSLRTRLISSDKYFPEGGGAPIVAYGKIFLKCAIISFVLYLVLDINQFVGYRAPDPNGNIPTLWTAAQTYGYNFLKWTIVPGALGVMTAITVDRPADRVTQRAISGVAEGAALALAAWLAVRLTAPNAPTGYIVFNFIIYGGLGGVFGYFLPPALGRYWKALESHLPEKVSVLRTSVHEHFRDIQQFTEWLNARDSAHLGGRRPVDILTEQDGLQRLTTLVSQTRSKV
jgi:hypothetical protein